MVRYGTLVSPSSSRTLSADVRCCTFADCRRRKEEKRGRGRFSPPHLSYF